MSSALLSACGAGSELPTVPPPCTRPIPPVFAPVPKARICAPEGAEWLMEGVDALADYALALETALRCWEKNGGKTDGDH